jgi:hypothetical protein
MINELVEERDRYKAEIDRHRAESRKYANKRYKNDPEYREKQIAYSQARYQQKKAKKLIEATTIGNMDNYLVPLK